MSKRNVAHVAQSTTVFASLLGQGNTMPEKAADTAPAASSKAVAIATAKIELAQQLAAEALELERNKETLRLSRLSQQLSVIIEKGDIIAIENETNKKIYGSLINEVKTLFQPMVMENVAKLVKVNLDDMSGNLGKYTVKSRKAMIIKAFAGTFEGFIIEATFIPSWKGYDVVISAVPSDMDHSFLIKN